MTTATAPAVEKRKKPWTKARVIDLIIDIFCFVIVGAASLTCILLSSIFWQSLCPIMLTLLQTA